MGQSCVWQAEYVSAALHGTIFASAVAVKSGEHAAKCQHSRPKGYSQEAEVTPDVAIRRLQNAAVPGRFGVEREFQDL